MKGSTSDKGAAAGVPVKGPPVGAAPTSVHADDGEMEVDVPLKETHSLFPRDPSVPYGSAYAYIRHIDRLRQEERERSPRGPQTTLAKFLCSDEVIENGKNEGESKGVISSDGQERVVITAWSNGRQMVLFWSRHAQGGWEFRSGWHRRLRPTTAMQQLLRYSYAWLEKRVQKRTQVQQLQEQEALKKAG
jgi:hypothetical protein